MCLPAAREAAAATIKDYASVAAGYAAGNINHDVSQNIEALLTPLATRAKPLDILDVAARLTSRNAGIVRSVWTACPSFAPWRASCRAARCGNRI